MYLKGKVKVIGQVETFANDFTKRNLVVTTDEQYPQDISIEFIKDKTSLLDNLSVGQEVSVSINIRGREWVSPQGEVKYFNTIQGWRLETSNEVTQNATQEPFETIPDSDLNDDVEDDLPF